MKTAMLLTAALCSASSFGAIRAITPTAWNGKPDCWQMVRHNEKMATVTNGGAKVVFIGDSITHFWESNGAAQLKKFFSEGDLKMLDLGTSADRTEHVLWRLTEGKELDGYEAKVIFLMIGTNNSGHFPFEKEPPIDTILGIREVVRTIRAKQPAAKLVITAIFPRGRDVNDGYRKRNEVVNKEIAKFADGKNVFWLDFNDQFMTYDGKLPREVFPDLLHPSAYGYEVWAAAVLPYAQAALAGSPLPPNRYAPFVRSENVRMYESISAYPAARTESDWWLDRMLEKRNQIVASDGNIDLVFFGDSITHNWDRPAKGGPALAEKARTDAGARSALALGTAAVDAGRSDEAETLLADAIERAGAPSGAPVRLRAYAALAANAEKRKDSDAALRYHLLLATLFDDPERSPAALSAAAAILRSKNRVKDAEELEAERARRYGR